MKYFIRLMLGLLFALSSNFMVAQSSLEEKAAIEKVIKIYLTVTDLKDESAIATAFHPDAKLMSVNSENELKQMSLEEWWSRISRIENPKIRKCTITILDVSGISAAVKVEFEKSSDIISLLKINNEWKIVNKLLSVKL